MTTLTLARMSVLTLPSAARTTWTGPEQIRGEILRQFELPAIQAGAFSPVGFLALPDGRLRVFQLVLSNQNLNGDQIVEILLQVLCEQANLVQALGVAMLIHCWDRREGEEQFCLKVLYKNPDQEMNDARAVTDEARVIRGPGGIKLARKEKTT